MTCFLLLQLGPLSSKHQQATSHCKIARQTLATRSLANQHSSFQESSSNHSESQFHLLQGDPISEAVVPNSI
ncbi:hypothetical protein MtrunA17_Chr7g0243751 [Medicago truncatula]|uniref:Uncharacterized protein n=1 Tax=Medicago truncatula TaxID=3880 RepID=A0A396GZZ6_MEDTR|nr:hypothetical protein MtrunA17_Chr7g0243751 [Medicago truncatula]